MSLAVNSEEPSNAGQESSLSVSSLTYAFTNVAGTVLFAAVAVTLTTGSPTTTGVTYGGDAMTLVPGSRRTSGINGANVPNEISMWFKLLPKTGSNNIIVTASTTVERITAGAISLTGNHTGTPYGVVNTAKDDVGSTSAAVTLNSTTTGNIVIAAVQSGTHCSSTAETLSYRSPNEDMYYGGSNQGSRKAAGGNVTMTETLAGADDWGMTAVEVVASVTTIPGIKPRQAVNRASTY